MDDEVDSTHFLSLDSHEHIYKDKWDIENDHNYPHFEAEFVLSPQKTYFNRQAYTLLAALGDFGGFNDALFLIIGSLSTAYSSKFFNAKIAQELKYKDNNQGQSLQEKTEIRKLMQKVNSNDFSSLD